MNGPNDDQVFAESLFRAGRAERPPRGAEARVIAAIGGAVIAAPAALAAKSAAAATSTAAGASTAATSGSSGGALLLTGKLLVAAKGIAGLAILVGGAAVVVTAARGPLRSQSVAAAPAPARAAAPSGRGPHAPPRATPAFSPSAGPVASSAELVAIPVESLPLVPPPARATAAPAPSAPEVRDEKGVSPATLAPELDALEEARRTLQRDPVETLRVLDRFEGERSFTALRDEAAVLRIDALAASGARDEARIEGERYLESNAGSPYASHVREALERLESARP